MTEDRSSLSHTRWNCKYHIVFAPKFRRQAIYGKLKIDIGRILRILSERKRVIIEEAELCPDHIHMLVEIPLKVAVSSFKGYLKGKSSLMICEKFPELKYKYRNREFWCRGHYMDTADKNAKRYRNTEIYKTSIKREQSRTSTDNGGLLNPLTGSR